MWKSFENFGLQTSEKVSWEKRRKKHAQNIRSTVHRTGDLITEALVWVASMDENLHTEQSHLCVSTSRRSAVNDVDFQQTLQREADTYTALA